MDKKFSKWAISFLLLFSQPLFSDTCPEVTPPLLKLLSVTGVETDGTFDGVVQGVEKNWLRPKDKERWQMPHRESKEIIDLASKLGFVHAVNPIKNNYRSVVVIGASILGVKTRLDYLASLWKKGLRCDKIVFLTGERPLDPQFESKEALAKSGCPVSADFPNNEAEMMQAYYEGMKLPAEMRKVPLEVISATGTRPTLKDTLSLFIKKNPKVVSALFISSQPYCLFQNTLIGELLEPGSFEVAGPAIKSPYKFNADIMLDSIASYLILQSKVCQRE